jgi:hypothetical protein
MSDLDVVLRDEHYAYLLKSGDIGGTADGFRGHVLGLQQRGDFVSVLGESMDELLRKAADRTWHDMNSGTSPQAQLSLCLGGMPCPAWLTFKVSDSGFGRILTHYAKIRHLHGHWKIRDEKAREAMAAADAVHELLEFALSKANGDMEALLSSVMDDMESVA